MSTISEQHGVRYFSAITYGALPWGIDPEYMTVEISNLPQGVLKVRRRMRGRKELHIFLKFKDRIEDWIPVVKGDKLKLEIFRGSNKTDL